MAQSDRVAGIYSEIKYKFDPKSVKNLRRFKRDLMELKTNLRDIKKLVRGDVKIGFTAKNAKVTRQVAKQSKEVKKDTVDTAKMLGKQNKLRENSLRLQANTARKQKAASDAAVTKAGKVWKQRQAMEEWMANQQRLQRESKKKELAIESKIAAQRAKIARMSGVASDRGNITPSSLNRVRQAQERLNRAYRDGSISASQFNTQSQRLSGILQRQSRVAKETTMSFNQMRTAVAGATGAYSAFAGAAGVKNIGGAFEDAQIMLEAALGAEEAAETMGFLMEQSQRLGIGATESAKGFARFSLAGKHLGFTTQELQEQFLGIAEAATVFGLRQDEITGTIRALEQMMSKNQIMS